MRRTALVAFVIALAAGGCTAGQDSPRVPAAASSQDTPAGRGLAFAQARCAACHAVSAGLSAVPEAPTFESIANTTGLSRETLRPWLRNSHNFPEAMKFTIAPEQVDDLAAYILTLKSPTYRPPIQ